MRVRAENLRDGAARHRQDPLDVPAVVGTRIDDELAAVTDDVGVGARPGQRARIRRDDAPDVRRDLVARCP